MTTAMKNPGHGRPADSNTPEGQVGLLFRELRRAGRLNPGDLEAHLQTDPRVLASLESGSFARLPPWPEIERIARAYAALIGLDPLPLVTKLSNLIYAADTDETKPYAKARPGFVADYRAGQSESDFDVRTADPALGPRRAEKPVSPVDPRSDPVVPDQPLNGTHFDPRQTKFPTFSAYQDGDLGDQTLAADPARAPSAQGSSLLKLLLINLMLLLIIGGGLYVAWTEFQVGDSFAAHNESLNDAVTRHIQALREIFR